MNAVAAPVRDTEHMDVPAIVALVIQALALRDREIEEREEGRYLEARGQVACVEHFAEASRLRERRLAILVRCGLTD